MAMLRHYNKMLTAEQSQLRCDLPDDTLAVSSSA
jgi:hypothetical protein